MMRRNWVGIGLIAFVLCLSVAFLTGCAKKATLKEGAVVTQRDRASAEAPAVAAETDDQAVKQIALRQKELQDAQDRADREAAERAAREAAAKEAAEKAAKEAAERAKMEAAAKAAAILKELQIEDIYFDFDKYNLKPEAQGILKNGAAAYLKYRDYKLVVEGHCDERGTAEYNLALGEKRATEAAKFLTDLGLEKERIKTISYGKEMPLDKGHDEAAWAKNRRAHFVVFPPAK
jgi:peptidoglycan-associated lipoprotein